MISPVPGTTLNLLKFPVTRPEPHFLANRRSRLTNANNLFKKMEIDRLKLLSSSKDVMLSVPSHYTIKHTLLSKIRDGKDDIKDNKLYSNTLDVENVPGVNAPVRLDPDERQWGKHCHDSPGTVSEDQIINLLTAEEISRVLTTKPIQPRTFLLKQGQTLLLGGLARLDVISCPKELSFIEDSLKIAMEGFVKNLFKCASKSVYLKRIQAFVKGCRFSCTHCIGQESSSTCIHYTRLGSRSISLSPKSSLQLFIGTTSCQNHCLLLT